MKPKINTLDRIVGWFAPGRALAMVRDRTMLAAATGEGGYRGGKRGRRATKNWLPGGGSADADLLPEIDDLRARSRDLARNMPIASGAIATSKTHVVGDGLVLNAECDRALLGLSETAAAAFNDLAEREFALWAKTADFTLVQHFADQQRLVFGGVKESGDIFVIRRWRRDPGQVYGTKCQVIEADHVSNPGRISDTDMLVAGIEHTAQGVPIAVHVSDRHPGDVRRKALTWRRVPMRYSDGRSIVLHVFERLRPNQTRGVPYLAPVIEAFKSLGDYSDAEVRAAVVSAMFTVFVKTEGGDNSQGPLPTSTAAGINGKDEVELGSGAIVDLAPGESIEIAKSDRPNAQFDKFVQAFLRQIGVALELPHEVLIKHFTASYSASRAALELAYHTFRRERNWLIRSFLAPVYEWFMEEAVLLGRIEAPGFFEDPLIRDAWLKASWTGPVRVSLDPKKDAEADEIDVGNGFKTYQQVMTERTGGDFEQKVERLKREKAALADAGVGAAPAATASPAAQADDDSDIEDSDEGDAE